MPWQPLRGEGDDHPTPLTRPLNHLLRHLRAPQVATVRSVFDRWPEIVGEGLAAHVRPVSLRDGRLVLAVEDPAWATQVRFLEPQILERLREASGTEEVTAIELRVRPRGGGSGPHPRR